MLVDCIPPGLNIPEVLWHSIRVRLEVRWIQKLDAQLNKNGNGEYLSQGVLRPAFRPPDLSDPPTPSGITEPG